MAALPRKHVVGDRGYDRPNEKACPAQDGILPGAIFDKRSIKAKRSDKSSMVWSRHPERRLVSILQQREPNRHHFFRCDPTVRVLLGQEKLLGIEQTNRYHHPSARLKLVDQRRRDQVRRR